RKSYDNLYFYTPHTRIVIYGPDRADRLTFYRETAPADLDVDREDVGQIVLPQNNPERRTRCTALRALVSEPENSPRMATGCSTPLDLNGRFVGAFGSSIQLGGYLDRAVAETVPGASNLIVSGDGGLVAYPGFRRPGVASVNALLKFERDMRLKETVAA